MLNLVAVKAGLHIWNLCPAHLGNTTSHIGAAHLEPVHWLRFVQSALERNWFITWLQCWDWRAAGPNTWLQIHARNCGAPCSCMSGHVRPPVHVASLTCHWRCSTLAAAIRPVHQTPERKTGIPGSANQRGQEQVHEIRVHGPHQHFSVIGWWPLTLELSAAE